MKFGALPEGLLSSADLRLPPEPVANDNILHGKRVPNPKVYIGAAQWGDKSWLGKLYPVKTPANQYRELYPNYFNAAELNATHYTIYAPDVLRHWAAAANGRDFKFCPKFPQEISHHSNFTSAEQQTVDFLESIKALGDHLGPAFLQLGEAYSPANKKELYAYLANLPKDLTFFLELRHPAWFEAGQQQELFEKLVLLKIGAVITDGPARRDAVHMHLTLPKLFLRFVCNGLHATSFKRTNDWIQQLQSWIARGLDEAYIFLHPGDTATIPDLTTYWIEQLNNKCNLQLKPPSPLQPLLF